MYEKHQLLNSVFLFLVLYSVFSLFLIGEGLNQHNTKISTRERERELSQFGTTQEVKARGPICMFFHPGSHSQSKQMSEVLEG